ncbi:NTE family protein [Rhizobium aethiopicum]|uniref:patatin-like phospholipase family protein n=1 Tax=Rhizobium aethiopicum TaxID=1138170 RepID=UPI0018539019|nr:patatin-like phospholipase family protein [Rhizobium aethiopicum]MBB4581522.1 NTE family protein [Rhizobium aethiopicum]
MAQVAACPTGRSEPMDWFPHRNPILALLFAFTGVIFFPRFALIALLASIAVLCLLARATILGFVSLDPVKEALDQLIAMKYRGRRDGSPVTFRELAMAGFPPLKIVAANISMQELTVFSAETTPAVAVSEAVCASIAIPCVFKPRLIEGNWFMDGGLVSNLPAWTFDDERSVDRDALTAAIEIGVNANKERKPGWTIGSMLGTMIFGAGLLNKRGVERLTAERLTVNVGLLDFDVGRKRASEIISETEAYCEGSLIARMIELPRIINDKCESVSRRCHGLISASYAAAGLEEPEFVTRIAIAIPVAPRYRTVRLEFSSGYTDLSDERITLPLERSLIGRSWNEDETLFASKSDPAVWNESLAAPQDRWLRKLIWKDLNWVLCVPLKIDEQTRVVVTLDCDRELVFDDDTQQELLNALEDLYCRSSNS